MNAETKKFMVQKVNELIQADSCCLEAKEAGKDWLDALGTANETEASRKLIAELKDDVGSIDGFISLLKSGQGAVIFGEDNARNMLAQAEESKNAGGKYCICAACQAGGAILDRKDELFG